MKTVMVTRNVSQKFINIRFPLLSLFVHGPSGRTKEENNPPTAQTNIFCLSTMKSLLCFMAGFQENMI